MTGFSETTLTTIEIPRGIPENLPIILDDCSLALQLGTRPKSLWWMLKNPSKHYKQFSIPKKRGHRRIYHPKPYAKRLLKRLNHRLLNTLQADLGAHVTAYRPNHSAKDAVLQHIPPCPVCDELPVAQTAPKHDCPREGLCIQTDLKDFFPSTRRAWVRNYFKSLGYSHLVSGYIASLVTVSNIPNRRYFRAPTIERPNIRKFFSGIPQGSPAAGAICNLVAAHRLDGRVQELLGVWDARFRLTGNRKFVYTRYSDDLTITCGRRFAPNVAENLCGELLRVIRETHYLVNKKKTRIRQGSQRRLLLGMTFNRHPNYPVMQYRKLRGIVHNCSMTGFSGQYERAGFETEEEFIDWLQGTINWVNQINPTKGAQLKSRFDLAKEVKTPCLPS